MAIAEMSKLNLVAMSYERDKVLNALQHTGAVEVKLHSQTEYAVPISADCEHLREYLLKNEDALSRLTASAEKFISDNKIKSDLPADCEISYAEFISAKDLKDEADKTVEEVNTLFDREKKCSAELAKVKRTLAEAEIYSSVTEPLKAESTAHARFRIGTIPAAARDKFTVAMEELPLASYTFVAGNRDAELIMVAAHKAEAEKADTLLQSFGFVRCPFDDGRTGEEIYRSLKEREEELYDELRDIDDELYRLRKDIRTLKIYSDFVAFELEKAELSEKMRATQTTFLLEAYVPAEAREAVSSALTETTSAVYFEFSKPTEEETPPTLLKNNKVVKNFEAITNMYSAPSSREFDPNTIMAFFYSVFLGFIIADMGYGLLMIIGGGLLWYKTSGRGSMMGKLGGVFAIGGILTVIWGFLFNSFFGFALLPFKVMPDLQGTEMSWSLAGIKVPALLIVSMLIGVVQLCAGYVCRAVQCWRRGQIADGILDGMVWALFSVGVELAIIGFVDEFNASVLKLVGGIIAGVTLLTAILTAGRKEKLLGKFTKGFGSAYGVINYASDILSYARLYGLMLAGAVIADIITSNSVSLMTSGNVGFVIMGFFIMVIGHIFNLAIGLLGAYIHDARLQYVEFYGRFYEGEGELFTPLGSQHKYIYVLNN